MRAEFLHPIVFCVGALSGVALLALALFLSEIWARIQSRRARVLGAARELADGDIASMKRYCSDEAIRAAMARAGEGGQKTWNFGKNS